MPKNAILVWKNRRALEDMSTDPNFFR